MRRLDPQVCPDGGEHELDHLQLACGAAGEWLVCACKRCGLLLVRHLDAPGDELEALLGLLEYVREEEGE